MMGVDYFVANETDNPELIKLMVSSDLNPESAKFYTITHKE